MDDYRLCVGVGYRFGVGVGGKNLETGFESSHVLVHWKPYSSVLLIPTLSSMGFEGALPKPP